MSAKRAFLPFALFGLLAAFFLITEIRGIDFGRHWDERVTVLNVREAVRRNSLALSFYHYPTLYAEVGLLAVLPELIELAAAPAGDVAKREQLLESFNTRALLFRLRLIPMLATAMALCWVFIAAWKRRDNPWEGWLAACFLGLSWEIACHARWFTVDPLVVHSAALTLLGICLYWRSPRWTGFAVAAIGAGLGMGSKYPAGLLIVPVLLAVFFSGQNRVRHALLATILFAATFLVTTPGIFIETRVFVNSVREVARIYAGTHEGYTIGRGIPHLLAMVEYVTTALFSFVPVLAAGIAALAVTGWAAVVREDWRRAAVLVSYPLALVGFFALQTVFVVRNIISIAPWLAILAAQGTFFLLRRFPLRSPRGIAITGAIGVTLLINAVWLGRAAASIPRGQIQTAPELFMTYVDRHPSDRVALSPCVRQKVTPAFLSLPQIAANLEQADGAAFCLGEGDPAFIRGDWKVRHHNFFTRWFGTYEVNLNYYPSWLNDQKIMMIDPRKANALGIDFNAPSPAPTKIPPQSPPPSPADRQR